MTHDCHCHGAGGKLSQTRVGALERPRYAPGLILEDSDLNAAVDYTRELNRLLFRSLFGCGVVCGLTVEAEENCGLEVVVAPGLALDGCGDPLHLREPVAFKLEERDGVKRRGDPDVRDFWVIACAGEKSCRPRSVVCDEDDLQELQQATRTRSTVDISISATPPQCVCACASYDPAGALEGAQSEEQRRSKLNDYANRLLPAPGDKLTDLDCCADPFGCHGPHRSQPGCPADCGCGDPCSCGCCVLLAWIHWFPGWGDGDARMPAGWGVLHNGVRRFIRPSLLPDPMAGVDQRPGVGVTFVEDQPVIGTTWGKGIPQEQPPRRDDGPPPAPPPPQPRGEPLTPSLSERVKTVADARVLVRRDRDDLVERLVEKIRADPQAIERLRSADAGPETGRGGNGDSEAGAGAGAKARKDKAPARGKGRTEAASSKPEPDTGN